MKNYRVQRENNKFYIYEVPTEQRIMKFESYDGANSYILDLNRGFGFNGGTPMFFTKSGKEVLENMNFKFGFEDTA